MKRVSQMFFNMIGKLPTLFKGVATCKNWRERCKGVCSQNSWQVFSTVSLHIELAKHFTFLITVCQLTEDVIYLCLYYTLLLSQICIDLFLVLNKKYFFFKIMWVTKQLLVSIDFDSRKNNGNILFFYLHPLWHKCLPLFFLFYICLPSKSLFL